MRNFFQILPKGSSENHYYENLLEEHHLKGHFYKNYPDLIPPKYNHSFSQCWKRQWLRNHLYTSELNKLDEKLSGENITVILLKGSVLIHEYYTDFGSRTLSDIDVLINRADTKKWKAFLEKNGYYEQSECNWKANSFKYIHIKKGQGSELVIETHTKLFYHEMENQWSGISMEPKYKNFLKLRTDEMLIHLVGHLAFQHNFSKLFWFVDIKLFLERNNFDINWQELALKVKEKKLTRSFQITLWLLANYFKMHFPKDATRVFSIEKKFWWKYFITADDLWIGQKFNIKYYFLKHITKDSLLTAFYYDFLWVIHKLFRNK